MKETNVNVDENSVKTLQKELQNSNIKETLQTKEEEPKNSDEEEKAYLYAIPYEYYTKYKLRRYGFHGTSHSFVSKRAVEFLGLNPENSKVIVCHLGNGSSISAVVNGKCVDTTMGLTPLEGVVMGTRSGNIDPAIMEFIAKKENLYILLFLSILQWTKSKEILVLTIL